MRDSFEDLYAEALRINAGQPTLQLSGLAGGATACAPPPAPDPASVLARLSGASSVSASSGDSDRSSSSSGSAGRGPGSRPSAAAMASSSAAGPASYPLPLQRPLSAASCCLDDLPAAEGGAASASGSWLALAAAVALWALAALRCLLGVLLRAELTAAERCTTHLARRLRE